MADLKTFKVFSFDAFEVSWCCLRDPARSIGTAQRVSSSARAAEMPKSGFCLSWPVPIQKCVLRRPRYFWGRELRRTYLGDPFECSNWSRYMSVAGPACQTGLRRRSAGTKSAAETTKSTFAHCKGRFRALRIFHEKVKNFDFFWVT